MPFTKTFLPPDSHEENTFFAYVVFSVVSKEDTTGLDIFLAREKWQPHYFISALVDCNFRSTQLINKFRVAYFFLLFPFD